jgi:hypothetical protein
MRTKTITAYCDICGKEINEGERLCPSDITPIVVSLTEDVFYGGTFKTLDICGKCNQTLLVVIEALSKGKKIVGIKEELK